MVLQQVHDALLQSGRIRRAGGLHQHIQRKVHIQRLQALPQRPRLIGWHIGIAMQPVQAGLFRQGRCLLRQVAPYGKQPGTDVGLLHGGLQSHTGRHALRDQGRAGKVQTGMRLPALQHSLQRRHGSRHRARALQHRSRRRQHRHQPLRKMLCQGLRQSLPVGRLLLCAVQQHEQLLRLLRPGHYPITRSGQRGRRSNVWRIRCLLGHGCAPVDAVDTACASQRAMARG